MARRPLKRAPDPAAWRSPRHRAYLDALGIDLDALTLTSSVLVPFIVMPDELYESKNVWPVFEQAPEQP